MCVFNKKELFTVKSPQVLQVAKRTEMYHIILQPSESMSLESIESVSSFKC